jgi:hypothetical protein
MEHQESAPREVLERVGFVIDRILQMAPNSAKSSMQYGMMLEFVRGMKKDLKLVPDEQILHFAKELGAAFTWVAEAGNPGSEGGAKAARETMERDNGNTG